MKHFAEFFAGVGLVREGLYVDGWSCVFANDICQDKRETYIVNYGDDHFYLADIWELAKHPAHIPDDVFMYTASFPCTDISLAGNRAGLEGKQSGALHALFNIIRAKRNRGVAPKLVMLENVRGCSGPTQKTWEHFNT